MIFGIGTDIVEVARIQRSLDKHGEKFAARILTEAELEDYRQATHPANFLAKRFAAKEATAKAMGTGFRNGLSLRHISVSRDLHARPELIFTGEAEAFMQAKAITEAHLSLADERDYAVAFVILSI
jgi:holo-[acyl-carrier protein] synthase